MSHKNSNYGCTKMINYELYATRGENKNGKQLWNIYTIIGEKSKYSKIVLPVMTDSLDC